MASKALGWLPSHSKATLQFSYVFQSSSRMSPAAPTKQWVWAAIWANSGRGWAMTNSGNSIAMVIWQRGNPRTLLVLRNWGDQIPGKPLSAIFAFVGCMSHIAEMASILYACQHYFAHFWCTQEKTCIYIIYIYIYNVRSLYRLKWILHAWSHSLTRITLKERRSDSWAVVFCCRWVNGVIYGWTSVRAWPFTNTDL